MSYVFQMFCMPMSTSALPSGGRQFRLGEHACRILVVATVASVISFLHLALALASGFRVCFFTLSPALSVLRIAAGSGDDFGSGGQVR